MCLLNIAIFPIINIMLNKSKINYYRDPKDHLHHQSDRKSQWENQEVHQEQDVIPNGQGLEKIRLSGCF